MLSVREVTYWLAIGNRTNNFIKGLIGSEDDTLFCHIELYVP